MKTKRTKLGALLAAVVLATVSYTYPMAVTSATPPDPGHKVTICHRTNSDTNPYVQITVDEAAVDGQKGADHYGEHKGPIWNSTLKAQKIEWGDIIPPVSPYHSGQNWTTEGRAIYDRGCTVGEQSTTTTTGPTTTTTVPPTTTTVPPTTTTVPPTTVPPTTVPPTTVPTPTTSPPIVKPPTLTPPPAVGQPAPVPVGGNVEMLPITGTSTTEQLLLMGFGLVLLGAGALISARSYRR